jgi:hypothetical protein
MLTDATIPTCYRAREAPFSNRNPRTAQYERVFSYLRLPAGKSKVLREKNQC